MDHKFLNAGQIPLSTFQNVPHSPEIPRRSRTHVSRIFQDVLHVPEGTTHPSFHIFPRMLCMILNAPPVCLNSLFPTFQIVPQDVLQGVPEVRVERSLLHAHETSRTLYDFLRVEDGPKRGRDTGGERERRASR